MEIQFYGANCVRLTTKKASIVVDDNLAEVGGKAVIKPNDIALFTHEHGAAQIARLVIDRPGEYEVSDVSIQGIAARAHIEEESKASATMFRLVAEDIRIAIVGHIYPQLSGVQLELLGTVDVLVIPIGNSGYTLDAVGALQLIKAIEPKLIIPTHYGDKGINYPVPQQDLAEALKGLSMEPKETVSKLKLKPGELGDTTELVVLERQQ